jgi:L-alanine-DL-glutamate epimerase-like enolase superfamily enzyme
VIPINAPAGAFVTTTAGRYFDDDLVTSPFGYSDGSLLSNELPGLGIEVDREKIDHYCVERLVSTGTAA